MFQSLWIRGSMYLVSSLYDKTGVKRVSYILLERHHEDIVTFEVHIRQDCGKILDAFTTFQYAFNMMDEINAFLKILNGKLDFNETTNNVLHGTSIGMKQVT